MAQTKRLSEMSAQLGGEQVLLERIEAVEALSAPFSIMVDMISPLEMDLQPHLGEPCALKVIEEQRPVRHFHGLIVSGEYRHETDAGHHYRLALKPWTYFLAQNRNMAIYQDKDAVAIIREVLLAAGISDISVRLSRQPDQRVYCVQYQESDFAFVSRLMEEEGIYYYFEHEPQRHVMVLCDSPSAHKDGDVGNLDYNPSSLTLFATANEDDKGSNFLQSWIERVSTTAEAKVSLRDYDFMNSEKPLKAEATRERQHPHDEREVFHYPGRFAHEKTSRTTQETQGTALSTALIEEFRSDRRIFTGTSEAAGLQVGTKLNVGRHPLDRMNGGYLITSTYHSIVSETYRSGSQGREKEFNVRFEAIPAATPYRPARKTPKPLVQGLESAIVCGPANEEIYTDEYGRVKVRFHWDRADRTGENRTCWIRVSQTGGLGNIILPRIGHEVLVDFLSGDPDRPVVVGRVFNKEHMPVYELPANKTRTLWRSKTYKESGPVVEIDEISGSAPKANELRFEDKTGGEEVYLHAEKDMNSRVRNDDTTHVGNNQDLKVDVDRKKKVGNNQDLTVGNNEDNKIGNNRTSKVGNNDELKIKNNLEIHAGNNIKIEADNQIEIIVGQSSIKIDQMGVTVKGMMLKLEGQVQLEMKSIMTQVNGDAMLTAKGGITMIN